MGLTLITGASGFLGREVLARLSRDRQVLGTCRRRPEPGLLLLDLRDSSTWAQALSDIRPDALVLCAAQRDPDDCEEHPEEARRINVEPVRVCCRVLPDSVPILLMSSDYVFAGDDPPYDEHASRRPVNLYGRTKLEAENLVLARSTGVVLRSSVLIGAGRGWADSGFIAQMRDAVLGGVHTEVDDVLFRMPTWTRDVAEAVAHLLAMGASGPYHIAGPRGGTRYALTLELAQALGRSADHVRPSRTVIARRAARPQDATLACNRIREAGFSRFTDFRDVVAQVLKQLG